MKSNLPAQLSAGLWLSLAVFIGIMWQSWSAMLAPIMLGAFFMLPNLAVILSDSKNATLRNIAKGMLLLFFGSILVSGGIVIERVYVLNAKSYPQWLSSAYLGNDPAKIRQAQNDCREHGYGPTEVIGKDDGKFVMRCGLFWPQTKTYITDVNPFPIMN